MRNFTSTGVNLETRQDNQMEFHGSHDEHNSTKQFLISSYEKNLLPILKEEIQRASQDEIRPGKSLSSRSIYQNLLPLCNAFA